MRRPILIGSAILAMAIFGLAATSPINPVAWAPPNNHLSKNSCEAAPVIKVVALAKDLPGKADGLAFGGNGELFASLSNGHVVAIDPTSGQWRVASRSGGFLTGLAVGKKGEIFAVDERAGALLTAKDGEPLKSALRTVDGQRLSWTNDVTILGDGQLFLTTTATGRSLDRFFDEVLEHRGSGLLVRFDPRDGSASILRGKLQMTNGVAAVPNSDRVLLAESSTYEVSLVSTKDGAKLASIAGLPGFTGNVRASDRPNIFWVTLLSPRSPLIDSLAHYPFARRLLAWLPPSVRPGPVPLPCLIEIRLEDSKMSARAFRIETEGKPTSFSTAIESNGRLFLSPASIVPGSQNVIYSGLIPSPSL